MEIARHGATCQIDDAGDGEEELHAALIALIIIGGADHIEGNRRAADGKKACGDAGEDAHAHTDGGMGLDLDMAGHGEEINRQRH